MSDEIDSRWMAQANCRGLEDPSIMFPERGQSTRPAMRVCGSCPVRSECLEFALENNERHGMWGGTSGRERRRIQAQRTKEDLERLLSSTRTETHDTECQYCHQFFEGPKDRSQDYCTRAHRQRADRDKIRAQIVHGTAKGARQHRALNQRPCPACLHAVTMQQEALLLNRPKVHSICQNPNCGISFVRVDRGDGRERKYCSVSCSSITSASAP